MMAGRDQACLSEVERGRATCSLVRRVSQRYWVGADGRTKSHYPSELESYVNSLDNLCLDSCFNLARFVVTIRIHSYDLAGCPCGHRLRRCSPWIVDSCFRKRRGRNCPNELLIFKPSPGRAANISLVPDLIGCCLATVAIQGSITITPPHTPCLNTRSV